MLPHELLVKIFYNLEQRPQHRHSSTSSISFSSSLSLDRTDILACALVCQDWYYAAVDTLWRDVDVQSVESFIQFGMVLDPTFSYLEVSPRLCCYQDYQQQPDEDEDEDTTTATSPASSSSSSSSSSSFPTASTSSSSSSSCVSLSSLRGPSLPDQIGYAGKGYIRTFSLAGTSDYMAVIQLITSSSPYLKRIDLTECRLLTNLTVQVIARLCSQLEELSLQGCGLITDDAIEELALHCTRLQSINIGQCQRAGDKSLVALLQASGRMTQLDPTSRIRTKNAQLTKLGVAGCRGITYMGLSAISERLAIVEQDGGRPGRSSSSLLSLEFTCPVVKVPTIENVNGLSMLTSTTAATSSQSPSTGRMLSQASRFFHTLPTTLEEISIHDAYTLTHSDILTLVDQVGSGLKVLRLDHANAINSDTLAHVLAVCPNLTVLSIPRASRLDDSGVIQLIGAKCARSLVELDLSACHTLSDGCLTALAKCSSTRSSTLQENIKGKGIQEPEPCLFPNLRRLDLSYNDKLTLGGIIPLVMSLKNLCALDVSFCGDGVTRSWSSTLESLRPILSSTSAMHSTGVDDLQGDAIFGGDHLEDEEPSSDSQQYSPQEQHQMQFPQHLASTTGSSPPQQYGLSSQNLQRFVNGVAPLAVPSRVGLGRYVGPLLNRASTSSSNNNDIVPQHPQQYPEQGGASLDRSSLGSRRRSSASSMASSTSSSSMSSSSSGSSSSSSLISDCSSSSSSYQGKSPSYHQGSVEKMSATGRPKRNSHSHSRRRVSTSRILLADRTDILESTTTPMHARQAGIPASFHLDAWFTPQHQHQLQHLFQIQLQHQRDLQDLQAAAAVALSNAQVQQAEHLQHQHAMNATLFANSMPIAPLSAEMMAHPVMTATRVGAASVGGVNDANGGAGGGGENHGIVAGGQDLFDSTETTTGVYHHRRRSVGHGQLAAIITGNAPGPGPGHGVGVGVGAGGGGVRHHHRHHYQYPHYHRRSSLSNAAATDHCEISAWGLTKLREEWAAVI
ncbi:hypothetical protein BGX33_012184 [Mortierella sp. NVP41]|nr:hypothetical protein BGX33_012184 [Mortierella sp. NVP41]